MSKLDMTRFALKEGLQKIKDSVESLKPGRNEPCHCGSGKKYKQCHMAADRQAEQAKRELVDAAAFLRRDLLKFARDERFAEGLAAALPLYWNDLYTIDNAEEMSQNEALRFFDWFVFDYQHNGQPRLIDVYRAELYDQLAESQQRLIDVWVNGPPAGAYELIDYEGQWLELRDFVTGERYQAYEPGGRGDVERGDLILTRLMPVGDRLEFSAVGAYLPQKEIGDLAAKLEAARAADLARHPEATAEEFMRRHNHLIIHHALEQAEKEGRPPVARLDGQRPDKLVQSAARQLKRFKSTR